RAPPRRPRRCHDLRQPPTPHDLSAARSLLKRVAPPPVSLASPRWALVSPSPRAPVAPVTLDLLRLHPSRRAPLCGPLHCHAVAARRALHVRSATSRRRPVRRSASILRAAPRSRERAIGL